MREYLIIMGPFWCGWAFWYGWEYRDNLLESLLVSAITIIIITLFFGWLTSPMWIHQ